MKAMLHVHERAAPSVNQERKDEGQEQLKGRDDSTNSKVRRLCDRR